MPIFPLGTSFALADAEGLLSLALIRPRAIGPFVADVTVREEHTDRLVIASHPVSTQANISDHAYKEPSRVRITCGFTNSGPQANGLGGPFGPALAALAPSITGALGTINQVANIVTGGATDYVTSVYQQFLALQAALETFDILTGKRAYSNMLIEVLQITTDETSENALMMICDCREVLMAQTQVVTVGNAANMANPQINGAVQNNGARSLMPGTSFNTTVVAQ